MTTTRQTADAILKEFYLGPARDTLNNNIFLLSQVEQTSERVEGREVVMAIRTGRNQGIGARKENAALPNPGRQRHVNVRHKVKHVYGVIEVTGQMIRSTASDRGSFTRVTSMEMEGVVGDLKNDVNRQLYGGGKGALAAATGAGNASGNFPGTFSATQQRQIVPGMVVDVVDPANGNLIVTEAVVEAVTPTAIDLSKTTAAVLANHVLVRSGSWDAELTGLDLIVDSSGALYGIDPATEPGWKSYEVGNAGPVTEDLYTDLWQTVNINTGEEPSLFICDNVTHRRTASLLTSLKRFPNTNELRGGYRGLDLDFVGQGATGPSSVTLRYDKDCPVETIFALTPPTLHFDRMSDWEFMDEDGAVLQRAVGAGGRRDAYEATLFCYADLCTHNRAAHAKATGVKAPA